jgi:hypothetical protein
MRKGRDMWKKKGTKKAAVAAAAAAGLPTLRR